MGQPVGGQQNCHLLSRLLPGSHGFKQVTFFSSVEDARIARDFRPRESVLA